MEDFILSTVKFVEDVDFTMLFKAIGVGFILIWISMAIWVWRDAAQRFESKVLPIVFGLVALIFSVFGYIAYMILRPKDTLEDKYWADREKEFLMHEIGDYDVCPNCKYDRIFVEFLKCPNCGFEIKHKCEGCNFALTKYWKHCPSCGTENSNYDPNAEADPNTVLVGQREKKQLAIEEAEEIEKLNDENDEKPEIKSVVPAKKAVKKVNVAAPIKTLVTIYADFFSAIGNAIISGFNGAKSGVTKLTASVKKLATPKKGKVKAKANLSINSVASSDPSKKEAKKQKAQKRKKRKRALKKKR